MGGDETVIAAGIGFRSSAGAAEIAELVREAERRAGLEPGDLAILATIDERAAEEVFGEAAAILALPTASVRQEDARAMSARVVSRSERVQARYGVGSAAEAAALWASGTESRVILPRIASARVTCALAEGTGR